jgi:small-conductance mechanosensitive channel
MKLETLIELEKFLMNIYNSDMAKNDVERAIWLGSAIVEVRNEIKAIKKEEEGETLGDDDEYTGESDVMDEDDDFINDEESSHENTEEEEEEIVVALKKNKKTEIKL